MAQCVVNSWTKLDKNPFISVTKQWYYFTTTVFAIEILHSLHKGADGAPLAFNLIKRAATEYRIKLTVLFKKIALPRQACTDKKNPAQGGINLTGMG